MVKFRCQAYLLTPESRRWHNYRNQNIRCRYSAKEGSNFCGNHSKLADFISEIVWKDDDGIS